MVNFYIFVIGAPLPPACDDTNAPCDTDVTSDTHCANGAFLISGGYLGSLPVSPTGTVTWDDGSAVGEEGAGYTVSYNSTTGAVTVRSCESENTTEIGQSR